MCLLFGEYVVVNWVGMWFVISDCLLGLSLVMVMMFLWCSVVKVMIFCVSVVFGLVLIVIVLLWVVIVMFDWCVLWLVNCWMVWLIESEVFNWMLICVVLVGLMLLLVVDGEMMVCNDMMCMYDEVIFGVLFGKWIW